MPLDVQGTLFNAVRALLLTYAPFTALVKPGNVIAGERRADDVEAAKHGAGDYPQVRIIVGDDTTNDRQPMPFNDDPAFVDYGVPMRLTIELRITHDSTDVAFQTPVEAAVRGALLRQGRKLGLPWVTTFVEQPVSRRVEPIGGTNRTIARQRLVVTARPMRSQLIATN